MNSINALKFLKTKCNKGFDNFYMKVFIKTKKLLTLFVTLAVVFFLYYFYMNVKKIIKNLLRNLSIVSD